MADDADESALIDRADPLTDLSLWLMRRNGSLLPHGGRVDIDGAFAAVMASPDGPDMTTSAEVLPVLHEALRTAAAADPLIAVAVVEPVSFAVDGGALLDAIKISVEHVSGSQPAIYAPIRKKLFRGYALAGDPIVRRGTNEIVTAWRASA